MRALTIRPDDRPTFGPLAQAQEAPCRPDPAAPTAAASAAAPEPRLDLRPPLKLDNLRPVGDTAALARLVAATDEALARYEARQAQLAPKSVADARWSIAAPPRRAFVKWTRRIVLGLGVLAAIGAAGAGLWAHRQGWTARWFDHAQTMATQLHDHSGLAVRDIEIVGRANAPPHAILDAMGVELGQPIMSLDLQELRSRLLRLGWIKEASVERILPDRLKVTIAERLPFARWQHDGRIDLIDRAGTMLEVGDYPVPAGLRRVVGIGAADKAAQLFTTLAAEPSLFARVIDMIAIRERRWDVVFDNGVVVKLPEDGIETAWARLAQLQAKAQVLDRDIAVLDMRIPDRLFVRLTPEAIAARQPPDTKKLPGKRS